MIVRAIQSNSNGQNAGVKTRAMPRAGRLDAALPAPADGAAPASGVGRLRPDPAA